MPLSYHSFAFLQARLEGRQVELHYELRGESGPLRLTERFVLPWPADGDDPDVQRALSGLHLACGASYYKTCCPPRMVVETRALGPAEARFWTELFTHGLGEFYFRNGLTPSVSFPAEGRDSDLGGQPLRGRPLVMVGGGKDSIVSYEALRPLDPLTFAVIPQGRDWDLQPPVAAVMRRQLDPQLHELNRQGAYNGHVPISAVFAFAAQLAALAGGHGPVVVSNERSASVGNVVHDGIEVNHQWTKSLPFETAFRAWQRANLSVVPEYMSLLRPLSELAIARAFAGQPQWFGKVTSCNKNFRQSGPAVDRWCGTCAKCLFVFAVTAPWLDDAGIGAVFGRDLFALEDNVAMVKRLLGLADVKPWDCVGTPEEVTAALWLCHQRERHPATPVMAFFRDQVLPGLGDAQSLVDEALAPAGPHHVPAPYLELLDAVL